MKYKVGHYAHALADALADVKPDTARTRIRTFLEILKKHQLDESEVAYIGDDLPDLPVLKRAGLSISVSSGIDEVKDHVHWVTKRPGGLGAVREAIDFILSVKKGEKKKNQVGFFKK